MLLLSSISLLSLNTDRFGHFLSSASQLPCESSDTETHTEDPFAALNSALASCNWESAQ